MLVCRCVGLELRERGGVAFAYAAAGGRSLPTRDGMDDSFCRARPPLSRPPPSTDDWHDQVLGQEGRRDRSRERCGKRVAGPFFARPGERPRLQTAPAGVSRRNREKGQGATKIDGFERLHGRCTVPFFFLACALRSSGARAKCPQTRSTFATRMRPLVVFVRNLTPSTLSPPSGLAMTSQEERVLTPA